MSDAPMTLEKLSSIEALLRRHLELTERQHNLLAQELRETRDIQRKLVHALQDLHSEIEFLRSQPGRDARLAELESLARRAVTEGES